MTEAKVKQRCTSCNCMRFLQTEKTCSRCIVKRRRLKKEAPQHVILAEQKAIDEAAVVWFKPIRLAADQKQPDPTAPISVKRNALSALI